MSTRHIPRIHSCCRASTKSWIPRQAVTCCDPSMRSLFTTRLRCQ
jgi:hypothetical protein